ncbi:MAG: sigma-70 family RNA polymerase sigma factor [Magnetococcales bacterium]|nr:RNA polymerase factor sigma-32 [Magnetococcales bacterium]NGZ07692.1 sigma-70 family RNA polymerase sigma factor [Magnetococcales bacterium]
MAHALVPARDQGELARYLGEINQFPVLTQEEEFQLAVRYYEHGDIQAAHKLVSAYLRYVVKIAREYTDYGLRIMDLVQEGSLGLMQAVKKFNPYKGFRLATYAIWWIRASIQEFILRSWSLVKIGTTATQRKLFFSLRRNKSSIERLDHAEAVLLGQKLGAKPQEILDMDGRLANRDNSLNRTLQEDGEELQNLIPDKRQNQELTLLATEAAQLNRRAATQALRVLNERERMIIHWRILSDPTLTLEEIGHKLGVSRERVRQLEQRALIKMRQAIQPHPALIPA